MMRNLFLDNFELCREWYGYINIPPKKMFWTNSSLAGFTQHLVSDEYN